MNKKYATFSEFYPFYLGEHSNRVCRLLHFVGTTIGLALTVYALWSGRYAWLLAVLPVGYGFAWVGHFFFEKNRPATFEYPLFSFMGDWVMWKDILIGKVRL